MPGVYASGFFIQKDAPARRPNYMLPVGILAINRSQGIKD